MKPRQYFVIGLVVLIPLLLCATAQTEVYRMHFNVYTTKAPDYERIDFWVEISDTIARPPTIVTSLMVQAPDGTVFDMTNNTWLEFYNGFQIWPRAEDFDTGVIPSGTYYARVIDRWGNQIIGSDDVQVGFLDVPVITYPTEGSTVGLTPTITWNGVPGAMRYRLLLWNDSWDEPVYWHTPNVKHVYKTHFKVEKGVLRPGTNYRVQIEAQDTDKDREKRSRSLWVYFNTAP